MYIENEVPNLQNLAPWRGLVKKSAIILKVGQCLADSSTNLIQSVMRKHLMLMWRVILPLKDQPLVSRRMADYLYWNKMFYLMEYFCNSRKYMVQTIWGSRSLVPTSSLSFELLVLSCWQIELPYIHPLPMVRVPPVCPLMSEWTAEEAPRCHFSTERLRALRVRRALKVSHRYPHAQSGFFFF